MDYISGVLLILGDPGAVSRAGRKGATKVRPDGLPLGLRGWRLILTCLMHKREKRREVERNEKTIARKNGGSLSYL